MPAQGAELRDVFLAIMLSTILQVFLLLFIVVMLFNIIIFVHELGHFLAGKWRGLQIDRFQIWFGKPIWKKKIGGVQYGLGWIPAGGFVALPQMAPMESIEGENTERAALPSITPMDKIIVAIAGPLFSILLALAAAVVVWGVGKPKDFVPGTTIGYVLEGSPAEEAGLMVGDEILEINGEVVDGFRGSLRSVMERIILSSGDEIVFKVRREGVEEPLELVSGFDTPDSRWFQRSGLRQVGLAEAGPARVGKVYEDSPADRAGIEAGDTIVAVDGEELFSDIQLAKYMEEKEFAPVELTFRKASGELEKAVLEPESPMTPDGIPPKIGVLWDPAAGVDVRIVHPNPFRQVYDSLEMMWVTVTKVADPNSGVGVDHLSGPVGIGQVMYSFLQTENGWRRILSFMVLFNVNLAVLNMLPFPILDGGHITLAIMEKIAGRPVQTKVLEVLQTGCALVLISLMVYVTSKDIGDSFGRGGVGGQGGVEYQFAPR